MTVAVIREDSEKKEVLESYLRLLKRLKEAQEELLDWKELAENEPADTFYTGNIILKEKEIAGLSEQTHSKRILILSAINGINDKRIRIILRRKYINGQSIENIARCTHYSLRHVKRLHRKGIEEIIFSKKMSP